jgi:hypothetical protein
VPAGAAVGVLLSFFALLGALSASAMALATDRLRGHDRMGGRASEHAVVSWYHEIASIDQEAALEAWWQLPPQVQAIVEVRHEQLVTDWLATQLERVRAEVDRGDCSAADERLARIARLTPSRGVPRKMACTPASATTVQPDRRPSSAPLPPRR